jgi:hypothetical protein
MLRIQFFWNMTFFHSKHWDLNMQWCNVKALKNGVFTQTVVKI